MRVGLRFFPWIDMVAFGRSTLSVRRPTSNIQVTLGRSLLFTETSCRVENTPTSRISCSGSLNRRNTEKLRRDDCSSFAAFTLIELLVVLLILSLAVMVIGASLAGGIRAWEAAYRFDIGESDTYLGLRMLRRDLMNSVPFHDIPFAGDSQSITIPSLSSVSAGGDRERMTIGAIRYTFDHGHRALVRQEWAFPGKAPVGTAGGEQIIRNLRGLEFRFRGAEGVDAEWSGSWEEATNLPAVVEINLNPDSDDMAEVKTTVVLPSWTRTDEEADEEDK